jgi:hypothetical protein
MRGVDTPNRLLESRDQRGSVSYFIGLQNAQASFGARRYDPIFLATPNLIIGRHMGSTGEDALRIYRVAHYFCDVLPMKP